MLLVVVIHKVSVSVCVCVRACVRAAAVLCLPLLFVSLQSCVLCVYVCARTVCEAPARTMPYNGTTPAVQIRCASTTDLLPCRGILNARAHHRPWGVPCRLPMTCPSRPVHLPSQVSMEDNIMSTNDEKWVEYLFDCMVREWMLGAAQKEWNYVMSSIPATADDADRDRGRAGVTLEKFCADPMARRAHLLRPEVIALRLCTGPGHHVMNQLLRKAPPTDIIDYYDLLNELPDFQASQLPVVQGTSVAFKLRDVSVCRRVHLQEKGECNETWRPNSLPGRVATHSSSPRAPLAQPTKGKERKVERERLGKEEEGGERPMGTTAYGGKGQGKGKGSREGKIGQGGRGRTQGGERPMGTTACGGKRCKGRAANGDRPIGAAGCRREQYTKATCQHPPLPNSTAHRVYYMVPHQPSYNTPPSPTALDTGCTTWCPTSLYGTPPPPPHRVYYMVPHQPLWNTTPLPHSTAHRVFAEHPRALDTRDLSSDPRSSGCQF